MITGLKTYQKEVIADLKNFIKHVGETNDLREAFRQHWLEKGIDPAQSNTSALHSYNNTLSPGVPNVTVKVPTAGGKTYIAANALCHICDYLPTDMPRVVAWFVPSDSILKQTLHNLSTPGHDYRVALERTFMGQQVVVMGKEQALMGTELGPEKVREQLTILVLSAQSFASKSGDDLRSWRQNAQFAPWEDIDSGQEEHIEDADPTSLIQWLAWRHPICVVDESHNFGSPMRTEMLRQLSPSFILNLTATPREQSNIVSFVDAGKLKRASMVKLPVVLYNMERPNDVLANAVRLQQSLERHAKQAQQAGASYIRPIVLLQAEPRRGDENVNFEKVRDALLKAGVPQEQIRRKLSGIDELKDEDLMSSDSDVRFIITVNALKEGWDCPFAYILAALSNRTSPIDVEQILGRILRQPYARKHPDELLNTSYVLTSSADFQQAAENVIRSLQKSGYSRNDCWAVDETSQQPKIKDEEPVKPTQTLFGDEPGGELELDSEEVAKQVIASDTDENVEQMIKQAATESEQYNQELNKQQDMPNDLNGMAQIGAMRGAVSELAASLKLPLFAVENEKVNAFMPEKYIPLTKEMLTEGFSLKEKDAHVDIVDSRGNVISINVTDSGDGQFAPKREAVNPRILQSLQQTFASFSPEMKRQQLTEKIVEKLRYNAISHPDLISYVSRALEPYNAEQLTNFYTTVDETSRIFKKKIDDLLVMHRKETLERWLRTRRVTLNCFYQFPTSQNVANELLGVDKSLYIKEEKVDKFEYGIISDIALEENVLFWHRNAENRKDTFTLNGFINHQPDFIVYLKSGDILLVEAKGDHLLTEKNRRRLELGKIWESLAGDHYHYYMVIDVENGYEGAISRAELLKEIRQYK